MRSVDELRVLMRDRGLRVTPQRECIMRYLHGNTSHLTVDGLYDAVRNTMPTIALKTVYQTVHDLEALGEVRLLDVGTGSVRVDPNVEHDHHHVVCSECGDVRDISKQFSGLALPRSSARGFRVATVEVIFRGICDQCRNHR